MLRSGRLGGGGGKEGAGLKFWLDSVGFPIVLCMGLSGKGQNSS